MSKKKLSTMCKFGKRDVTIVKCDCLDRDWFGQGLVA